MADYGLAAAQAMLSGVDSQMSLDQRRKEFEAQDWNSKYQMGLRETEMISQNELRDLEKKKAQLELDIKSGQAPALKQQPSLQNRQTIAQTAHTEASTQGTLTDTQRKQAEEKRGNLLRGVTAADPLMQNGDYLGALRTLSVASADMPFDNVKGARTSFPLIEDKETIQQYFPEGINGKPVIAVIQTPQGETHPITEENAKQVADTALLTARNTATKDFYEKAMQARVQHEATAKDEFTWDIDKQEGTRSRYDGQGFGNRISTKVSLADMPIEEQSKALDAEMKATINRAHKLDTMNSTKLKTYFPEELKVISKEADIMTDPLAHSASAAILGAAASAASIDPEKGLDVVAQNKGVMLEQYQELYTSKLLQKWSQANKTDKIATKGADGKTQQVPLFLTADFKPNPAAVKALSADKKFATIKLSPGELLKTKSEFEKGVSAYTKKVLGK